MNEVIQCLVERRSCKKYLPKQVDEAALQEILLAGTYAPSGKNRQASGRSRRSQVPGQVSSSPPSAGLI